MISDQDHLVSLLAIVGTIAVVGFSANPARPSNEVARFLLGRKYDCIGINSGIAGRTLHGIPVVVRLADIGRPVDMVDIFRASHAVDGIVDEALALIPRSRTIWMQLGVIDEAAKGARKQRA